MPTITIRVQADPSTGTLTVNGVADGYQTDVSENPSQQTIEWNLNLQSGQSGSFNSVTDATNPGFSWTYTPPPPLPPPGFTSPSNASSTQITLGDTHTQYSNNNGTWTYKLCATVNDTLCQTNPPSARGLPGDPKIKNK